MNRFCFALSLAIGFQIRSILSDDNCQDELPATTCTAFFCQLSPYVALQICKKTCNNCNGCTCFDSDYPYGVWCKTAAVSDPRHNFCTVELVWKKCPLKCNKCHEILAPNCPQCVDTNNLCTTQLCDDSPGVYYSQCKKTCNNCNGCKCVDSLTTHCATLATNGECNSQEALTKCPRTCGLCQQIQSPGCTIL